MLQATCLFTTQRWRLFPTGAAAVVAAMLMRGLLAAGASGHFGGHCEHPLDHLLVAVAAHMSESDLPALPQPVLPGS